MKTIVWVATLILVAFGLSGCCSMHPWAGSCSKSGSLYEGGMLTCAKCGLPCKKCTCPSGPMLIPKISTAVLKALIDSGTSLTLLDARTAAYDDGRRIDGAKSLSPDIKDEEILATVKSKDALIVAYCSNLKCPLSMTLAGKLRALGYLHVLVYPWGIEGWVAEGNPITRVKK